MSEVEGVMASGKNFLQRQSSGRRRLAPAALSPRGWSPDSSVRWIVYSGLAIIIVVAAIIFLAFGNRIASHIDQLLRDAATTIERAADPVPREVAHQRKVRPPSEAGDRQDLSLSDLELSKLKPAQKPPESKPPVTERSASIQPTMPSDNGGLRHLPETPVAERPHTQEPPAVRKQSEIDAPSDLAAKQHEVLEPPSPPPTAAADSLGDGGPTKEREKTPSVAEMAAVAPTPPPPRDEPGQYNTATLQPPPDEHGTTANKRALPDAAPPRWTQPRAPMKDRRDVAILLAEGDSSYVIGEVQIARIAYESAFEKGSAEAARRMGETFDPTRLERSGWPLSHASPTEAILWYEDAIRMGDEEAELNLEELLLWLEQAAALGDGDARRVLEIWRDRQG